jgi:hypothetical protein
MKKRKITPTKLQKRAAAILRDNPEKSLAWAMKKAGYKPSTSRHPGKNFLALKGTAVAVDQWREALRGSGLDESLLIRKYKEWIDATKIKSSLTEPDKVVPDYETQLKVKDDIRRDLGLSTEKEPAQPINVFNLIQLIKKQKEEYGI